MVVRQDSNQLEEAYGMPNLAAESASGGLRATSCARRTAPANFALEGLMNEAAASAGADPSSSASTTSPTSV